VSEGKSLIVQKVKIYCFRAEIVIKSGTNIEDLPALLVVVVHCLLQLRHLLHLKDMQIVAMMLMARVVKGSL
jgi:branched-subunit amino acid transport protein AzlD